MEKESKWSKKYKDSIDCSNPKGFSQRAHCQGLKKKKSKASILDELNRIAHHLENQNESQNDIENQIKKLSGQSEWGPEKNVYMDKGEIERRAASIK